MTTVNKEKTKISVNTRLITLSAVFAAMTYALTAFLHIPTAKGYIHIGDAVIFIAASLLPKPYAMASAAMAVVMVTEAMVADAPSRTTSTTMPENWSASRTAAWIDNASTKLSRTVVTGRRKLRRDNSNRR